MNKHVNDRVKNLLEKVSKKYQEKYTKVIKYTLTANSEEFEAEMNKELKPKHTQMTCAEQKSLIAQREFMTDKEVKSFEDLEDDLNEINEIRYIPVRIENLGKKKFVNLEQNDEDLDDDNQDDKKIESKGKKEGKRTRIYMISRFIQNVLR